MFQTRSAVPTVITASQLLGEVSNLVAEFASNLPDQFNERMQALIEAGKRGSGLDLDKAQFEAWFRREYSMPAGVQFNWEAEGVASLFKGWSAKGNQLRDLHSGIAVTGFQLVEALSFMAPDSSREQLAGDLVIELHAKGSDFPEAGLYAYHLDCPEEGSVFLPGDEVNVIIPEAQYDWGIFAGYLLDHCEGENVTEENLHSWLSDMLKNPAFGPQFRREVGPNKLVLDQLVSFERPFLEGRKLIEEVADHFGVNGYDEWCARLDKFLKTYPVGGAEEGSPASADLEVEHE